MPRVARAFYLYLGPNSRLWQRSTRLVRIIADATDLARQRAPLARPRYRWRHGRLGCRDGDRVILLSDQDGRARNGRSRCIRLDRCAGAGGAEGLRSGAASGRPRRRSGR